jgi:transcriptional regulator with XRE-family HTH domain
MFDPMQDLGPRLKTIRLASEKSLREVARSLEVSPSFLSQIENGKSHPSVATLYSLARYLGVPVDTLFAATFDEKSSNNSSAGEVTSRTLIDSPADAWDEGGARVSLVNPQNRSLLTMESGVRWERLAATQEGEVNFMEIIYEPGAGSNANGELVVHDGYEYGYALEGEIEVTIGESVLNLSKNQSIGFDSSMPHRFQNTGSETFRGIWFVHGCHPKK